MERHPTAATLADIYRAEGSRDMSDALGWTMGTTSDPEEMDLPLFALQVVPDRSTPQAHGAVIRTRYMATLGFQVSSPPMLARYVVTRHATPGRNHSLYLKEGIYETNYTIDVKEVAARDAQWKTRVAGHLKERWSNALRDQIGEPHQPRVYFYMPNAMAVRNCAAEQEHLDDMRRAYALTLGAVEDALAGVNARGANESAARAEAERQYADRFDVSVRAYGGDMTRWRDKYLQLCAKSKKRDDDHDHDFGFELVEDLSTLPALPITWLTPSGQREENGKLYVRVTIGTTRVPGHRSQDIIVY